MAVEFNLGNVGNEKLGEANLIGNILCVLPFGLYPNADIANIYSSDQELTEWAVKINLIRKGDKYYDKFCKNYASFAAYTIPDFRLNNDKMHAYKYLIAWSFVFDDIVDNMKDHRFDNLELSKLSNTIDVFMNIFNGKYSNLSAIPTIEFPLYQAQCKALLDFHLLSKKSIDSYEIKNSYFLKGMENYFKGVIWDQDDNEISSEETYMFRRKHTTGAIPIFEYIALMNELTISEDIRQNLLFKRLQEAATNAVYLTNDILSLRKELSNNETQNLIIVKTVQHMASVHEAFVQVNKLLNNEIQEIIKLSDKLKRTFPLNKVAHKYIENMENFVDGHLYWYANSCRYGNIKLEFKKLIP